MDMDEIRKEIRKCRTTLRISGLGLIAFSVWDFVKILMTINDYMPKDEIEQIREFSPVLVFICIAFALLIVAFFVGLQMGVGFAAIKDSESEKRSFLYLIGVFVFGAFYAFGTVMDIYGFFVEIEYDVSFAVFIIDITSLFLAMDIAVNAVKKRIMLRKIQEKA